MPLAVEVEGASPRLHMSRQGCHLSEHRQPIQRHARANLRQVFNCRFNRLADVGAGGHRCAHAGVVAVKVIHCRGWGRGGLRGEVLQHLAASKVEWCGSADGKAWQEGNWGSTRRAGCGSSADVPAGSERRRHHSALPRPTCPPGGEPFARTALRGLSLCKRREEEQHVRAGWTPSSWKRQAATGPSPRPILRTPAATQSRASSARPAQGAKRAMRRDMLPGLGGGG